MATTTQFRVQAPSTIPLLHLPLHLLPRFPRLLAPVLVVLLAFCAQSGRAALLQGCDFGDELCDPGEVCIPDGLFGQCYSDPEAALIRPLILDRALKDAQSELLRSELGRLAEDGLDWPHARSQCVLAYFKLTVAFQLDYDKDFCAVRDPANIWALVQRVQNALLSEEEENEQRGEDKEEENGEKVEETGDEEDGEEDKSQQQQQQGDEPQSILLEGDNEADEKPEEEEQENGQGEGAELVELIPVLLLEPEEEEAQPSYEMAGPQGEAKERRNETKSGEEKRSSDEKAATSTTTDLAPEEQAQLDKLLHKMLENKRNMGGAEAGALNQHQLARLVQFVRQLQNMLLDEAQREENQQENEEAAATMAPDNEPEEGESAEEEAESTERDGPVLVLKKDTEQFDNADMGLAHTVHKIVKGGIQRVEGNRVYLRVAKENLTEEELYKLITYLDRKIASPNRLYFDQFLYQDGQLSFRISRALPSGAATAKLGSASGVAQAVYKRRKDIQTLAGVRVDETGIGSGQDVVPVERSQRDQLFFPILAVCGLTICALLSVLAASLVGRYRRNKATACGPLLPQTIDQLDSKMYEQLCRQRAADSPRTVAVVVDTAAGKRSKTSSTSSWPGDEPPPTDTDLDIGTGHVLLAFLQKHLDNSSEMDKQWQSVRDYAPMEAQVEVAKKPENLNKNLDPTVLPYDDSRVKLRESGESDGGDGYVNASAIYDSNPEHPAYIAAQAPVDSTVAQFWQMIWEQGIGLLVNLCDQQETSTSAYTKYWPEEGSKVFGVFEIHLVSEHIWSEHYVVRSLYLKNTGTQETRTVTQFHFLSWPANGVPNYSRALLEFRRKVNKSYRGRASPVLVHCTNGGGRTGTYILIDMTINRIQKGIKELNIAASLEHLRDQRMGMVENEQQFKCVFSCVADEVSSLLKGLQH